MQEISINVTPRLLTGKAEANRARRNNLIPAVIYSKNKTNLAITVGYTEFYAAAKASKSSQLFTLKSEDPTLKDLVGRKALVKEIQKDYLKDCLTHVDFQLLEKGQAVSVDVPLHIKGEAPGVKTSGGVLAIVSHEIKISCLPEAIPEYVEVDISKLELGDSIHANEITLPAGIKLVSRSDETLVSVVASKTESILAEAAKAPEAVAADAATAAAATPEGAAAAEAPAKEEKKK